MEITFVITRVVQGESQGQIFIVSVLTLDSIVLTFFITSDDADEVYFAYCYPYSYSDCCAHLLSICTQ
jgi:hypothetical protein